MLLIGYLVGAAALAWALTGLVRRYAIAREMWDLPSARSSHRMPTPRGGGLAIAAATLGAVVLLGSLGMLDTPQIFGLLGGGVLVAAVGWTDDRRSVPAWLRALCHLAAALLLVWSVGGLAVLRVGESAVRLGPVGSVLAVVGVVWAINLYNFMDGIDGLAAGQAVVAAGTGCILLAVGGATGLAAVSACIAGSSAGFLVWNWSPARIFMGDVGSGLLGFLFAALALYSEATLGPPLWCWLLLLGVFLFDATVTLIRRVARGEQWYAAHRSHAYQRAVLAGWSHARVTLMALGISAFLAGLALLGAYRPGFLAYLCLVALGMLALTYRWVESRQPMKPRAASVDPAPGG